MAEYDFEKAYNEVLDYSIDWTKALATSETISTSSWTAETGITVGSNSHDNSSTTVWLSGGTDGSYYKVKNVVTTSASRTMARYFNLYVHDRRV